MNKQMHTSLWEQYELAALVASKQGNLSKASRILKEALREAEEYSELPAGLIDHAYLLAELHLSHYRYGEAESLFRMVLEVREKLLGQTHEDVVESLKQVAMVQILSFRAEALGRQIVHTPMPWADTVAAAS
jgi:tetratricopeptide (TPR) repeat protein